VKIEDTGWSDSLERWLTTAVDLIHTASTEIGEGPAGIATIGLGVPRPVDPKNQRLVSPPLEAGGGVTDPARLLTERLRQVAPNSDNPRAKQLQVLADNDATLGALAESTYGHPDKETLVYVKASTGVGAGFVIGGRILRGRRGLAGEIGHIVVERGGRFCLCGSRGCLETVVGERALLDQTRTALGDRFESIDDLIGQANVGNAVCRRVLREAAYSLGITLGNICNVLSPDVIVLGGALGRGYEVIKGPCRAGLQQSALTAAYTPEDFHLVASSVPHATSHGGLLLGLQGTVYPF
jgi:predicted NBD/HSP70 family sugar kinase